MTKPLAADGKHKHLPRTQVCEECGMVAPCELFQGKRLCYSCFCPEYPHTVFPRGCSSLSGEDQGFPHKGNV